MPISKDNRNLCTNKTVNSFSHPLISLLLWIRNTPLRGNVGRSVAKRQAQQILKSKRAQQLIKGARKEGPCAAAFVAGFQREGHGLDLGGGESDFANKRIQDCYKTGELARASLELFSKIGEAAVKGIGLG